jgi:hypothetical protein
MIQDKAMLIRPTLSKFTPYKYDRNMSNQTAAIYGASTDYVRTSKRLVSKSVFSGIEKIDTEIRQFIYHNTRPWFDEGWRILATAMYFDVTDGLAERFAKREALVADFVAQWPEIKAEAQRALNDAYREEDFPEDVASRFHADVIFMPIPRTGDFRAEGLDPEDISKIEADTLARIQEQFNSNDLWRRVYDTVQHISERLHSYGTDASGKVINRFHDTLITNLRDLTAILPKLNITNDPDLADMHQVLEREICVWDAQTLRDHEIARVDVAAKADEILKQCAAYMA